MRHSDTHKQETRQKVARCRRGGRARGPMAYAGEIMAGPA